MERGRAARAPFGRSNRRARPCVYPLAQLSPTEGLPTPRGTSTSTHLVLYKHSRVPIGRLPRRAAIAAVGAHTKAILSSRWAWLPVGDVGEDRTCSGGRERARIERHRRALAPHVVLGGCVRRGERRAAGDRQWSEGGLHVGPLTSPLSSHFITTTHGYYWRTGEHHASAVY